MMNIRHGRRVLFRSPSIPGSGSTSIDSGTNFGTFQVGGYSRFTGMFAGVSSATIRYRMGVHSGDYQVTSSFVVNSGPNVIDVLNFGLYVNFDVFAAPGAQQPDYLVFGEPIR